MNGADSRGGYNKSVLITSKLATRVFFMRNTIYGNDRAIFLFNHDHMYHLFTQ
jgi:hypothetical protein